MEEFLLETRRHGWPSFRDEGTFLIVCGVLGNYSQVILKRLTFSIGIVLAFELKEVNWYVFHCVVYHPSFTLNGSNR